MLTSVDQESDLIIRQLPLCCCMELILVVGLLECGSDSPDWASSFSLLPLCHFQEKHMTVSDINTLTRQKELLLQKLSTFEETNRTLRDLLREQHSREVSRWKLPQRLLLGSGQSGPETETSALPCEIPAIYGLDLKSLELNKNILQ